MNNVPRDHHYVPQFFLRNFAVDPEHRKITTVAKHDPGCGTGEEGHIEGELPPHAIGRRHGTWEGDESDLQRIDPPTGKVLEKIEMPRGVAVSGLEFNGGDQFFCSGGNSGKVRAVRRPT